MSPHDHRHAGADPGAKRRALWVSLGANGVFMVVEVVAGFAFGSLALLADAAHMTSDVVGLAIALVALSLLDRPASPAHTFGWGRAEALGALANVAILLVSAGWIVWEAARRLGTTHTVDGPGVIAVAIVGLGVNVASAWILARNSGRDLNMRGAYLHMALDALGSIGAVVAGVAIVVAHAEWMDPVVSFVVSALVVFSAWTLLRATVHVLLEGTPRAISVASVEAALRTAPGVTAVHHLHLWDLSSETTALSAHVVLDGEPSLHEAQLRGDDLKRMLVERFGIAHATLELECHDCEPAPERPGAHSR